LKLNPDLILARRGLGIIYASKGKVDKAIETWRETLSIDPNDITTLVLIGVQLAQQELVLAGEEYLQTAYELAPENPAVINGYAYVMYLAGDIHSARDIVNAGDNYFEGNPSFEGVRAMILGDSR
jgi:cytochrome c-type biogenesis protein CcmH/NrfG